MSHYFLILMKPLPLNVLQDCSLRISLLPSLGRRQSRYLGHLKISRQQRLPGVLPGLDGAAASISVILT